MKKTSIVILFIFLCCEAYSQVFRVDTLFKTGPVDRRLNVVILGDGFTAEELPTFTAEAKKYAEFFLGYEPYNRYRAYFNFFAIPTPSKESGVTNPGTAPDRYTDQPVGVKDTFYGASFGTTVHRGVYITKYNVLSNVLAYNFPAYDLVVVLVNTTFYGGTGGSVAVHTLHASANTIGVHEAGHTLTSLADEYWPDGGWETHNMTQTNDPLTVRWKNWLGESNVNIYPHGFSETSKKWFKPSNGGCLMEYLSRPMCAVCSEATAEKILSIVNPVDKAEPDTTGILALNATRTFKLDLVKPQPNTLQVEWNLNGKFLSKGVDEITLNPRDIPANSVLSATIFDSTKISRRDNVRSGRTSVVKWNVKSSGFQIDPGKDRVCAGTQVSLVASGCPGVTSWSTGVSGSSIVVSPLNTTQYTAYCKVDGKETASASANVEVLPLPIATAINTGPYLAGSNIELTATGGTAYSWTGPLGFSSTVQNPVVPDSRIGNGGVYEVKVTGQNGCFLTVQTNVQVDPILGVGQGVEEMVTVSPNPARDFIKVKTRLSGPSKITIYDLNGRELREVRFRETTEFRMNAVPGIYVYRFSNPAGEVAGKVVVE